MGPKYKVSRAVILVPTTVCAKVVGKLVNVFGMAVQRRTLKVQFRNLFDDDDNDYYDNDIESLIFCKMKALYFF
jgi:hypothetical protein